MLQSSEIREIRKDFPFLELSTKEKPLVYLDSAATTQKPRQVIEAMNRYYSYENGGPHRGAHRLSMAATEVYEGAREAVKNLLAYCWGLENLKEGDEIVLSIMEHHANLVTWQYVAEKTGAKLVFLYIDENKEIPKKEIEEKITAKTKLLAITQSSNVLGTMPDVKAMIAYLRKVSPEAKAVVDGAQAAPHMPVDVKDLDCDFYVFSGHKMLAAMPYMYGGDMIEYVYEDHSTFLKAPGRFEAGTQDVGAASSLPVAIDYLNAIGLDKIHEYESYLVDYAYDAMSQMDDITILSRPTNPRGGLITFNFKDVHPHDVASILDSKGIAIRSGHHCAQPLHRSFGIHFSCRASFAVYNTIEEVDYFIKNLDEVRRLMGLGTR